MATAKKGVRTRRTTAKKVPTRKASPRKAASPAARAKARKAEEVMIRTEDIGAGDEHDIDISSSVETDDIERPDLAMVTDDDMDSPHVKEYVDDLKFMEDVLTVSVGETTDENAENPVPCAVNGERRLLMRGVEYKLQRKFVDSLIKREDKITTKQYRDDNGDWQTKIEVKPRLKYPVNVHNDPAGDVGRRWFEHQCKNAW